ncbi:hypothetical protein H4582DRAFT_2089272 [Lactarius indigo]|nr:hypothetical protein H4582DRAFT_2089272 [Lactarius indigo]
MSLASLPSIPSLYETTECATPNWRLPGVSLPEASSQPSEPTSPYKTAEPAQGLRVIRVVSPQPVEEPVQIIARSVDKEVQAIPEPVEEPALIAPPPCVEEAVQVIPPQHNIHLLYPAIFAWFFVHWPSDTLLSTSLSTSVTESTPTTIVSRHSAGSWAPSSPTSTYGFLWAPEMDDTYKLSILRASLSVQSIAFPEGPYISFDTSFLRPTASAYTSQEPSRLSTIDESQSSESPPITYSSSSITPTVSMSISASAEPSPSPTGTVSISASASATPSLSPTIPPTILSPSLRAPSNTTVSSPILSAE